MLKRLLGRDSAEYVPVDQYAPFYRDKVMQITESILSINLERLQQAFLDWSQTLTFPGDLDMFRDTWINDTGLPELKESAKALEASIPQAPKGLWNMHVSTLRLFNAWIDVFSKAFNVVLWATAAQRWSGIGQPMGDAARDYSEAVEEFSARSKHFGRDLHRLRESDPRAFAAIGLDRVIAALAR
jgi:hypothetical protein